MCIIVIGGHDGMHGEYEVVCSKRGHDLKVFTQLPTRFEKVIGQPDGIVLFTSTVSHAMAKLAVKVAKTRNIPVIRSHSSSTSSLNRLISTLEDIYIKQ
ncbi:MAG: DUF2325 domain-containing protein [Desulfitobacterium hafniense]|nr:DUF2325 domain-containing protein [Desulfitobacterium hafniense]